MDMSCQSPCKRRKLVQIISTHFGLFYCHLHLWKTNSDEHSYWGSRRIRSFRLDHFHKWVSTFVACWIALIMLESHAGILWSTIATEPFSFVVFFRLPFLRTNRQTAHSRIIQICITILWTWNLIADKTKRFLPKGRGRSGDHCAKVGI